MAYFGLSENTQIACGSCGGPQGEDVGARPNFAEDGALDIENFAI
jgi:hypothetical protein